MNTAFLTTWLILTIIYLIGFGFLATVLLLEFVKYTQRKFHNWVNNNSNENTDDDYVSR